MWLNGFIYIYLMRTILFIINYSFAHSYIIKHFYFKQFNFANLQAIFLYVLLCITNNLINQSFLYVLFQTIQLSIGHLLAHRSNVKLLFDP